MDWLTYKRTRASCHCISCRVSMPVNVWIRLFVHNKTTVQLFWTVNCFQKLLSSCTTKPLYKLLWTVNCFRKLLSSCTTKPLYKLLWTVNCFQNSKIYTGLLNITYTFYSYITNLKLVMNLILSLVFVSSLLSDPLFYINIFH